MSKVAFPTLPDGRVDAAELRVTKRRSRFYWHPENEPGDYFVSVTNVAKIFDNAMGLSWWQRGVIAGKWLEDPGYAARLSKEGADAKKTIIGLPDVRARQAANLGTFIHAVLEKTLTEGFSVGDVEETARLEGFSDAEVKVVVGKYEQAMRALSDLRAVPLGVEAVCYHRSAPVKYAGTIDLLCRLDEGSPVYELPGLEGRKNLTAIVDFKTGKGVYDASALQVAAYLKATDFYATPEPLVLDPENTLGLVLHARERSYSWLPVAAGPSWDAFRACLAVYACQTSGSTFLADPILR